MTSDVDKNNGRNKKDESLEKKEKREKQEKDKKTLLRNKIIFGALLTAALFGLSAYSALSIKPSQDNCFPKLEDSKDKDKPPKDQLTFMEDLEKCGLNDSKLWKTLIVVMTAGAAGGLVFELLNLKGNIEWPHGPTKDELAVKFAYATPENVYDLGYLARLIIGALSAPITIAVVPPSSVLVMLTTSVVAGSSGALIFRALQDRLTAAIYRKELEEAKTDINKLKHDAELIERELDKASKEFTTLRDKIVGSSGSISSDPLTFPPPPDGPIMLSSDHFSNVWIPLNVAKAVANAIQAQTDDSRGLRDSVDKANDAFARLRDAVYKVSDSPSGELERRLIPGKTLDVEYFHQVEKLLNEAKGLTEKILTADNGTTDE